MHTRGRIQPHFYYSTEERKCDEVRRPRRSKGYVAQYNNPINGPNCSYSNLRGEDCRGRALSILFFPQCACRDAHVAVRRRSTERGVVTNHIKSIEEQRWE
jgi:hypothetical protein